ncbi:MAG: serine/threonine protein phosphatase [Thermoplasmata archaeon]|nr:serine/threonine protein phosphatase [Thermoplasmata archaeon]
MNIKDWAGSIVDDKDKVKELSEDDAEEVSAFLNGMSNILKKWNTFPLMDFKYKFKTAYYLYFVGDLHGDLITAQNLVRKLEKKNSTLHEKGAKGGLKEVGLKLLFMGNYIDLSPPYIENGGLKTLLFLLAAKATYPEDIYLLRGNHEAKEFMEFSNYHLPDEVEDMFGENMADEIMENIGGIFSSLPLFARTPNGIVASHAAFPRGRTKPVGMFKTTDAEIISATVWGSPRELEVDRGEISDECDFDEEYLNIFLNEMGRKVLIRGHDKKASGYSMYDGKILTLCSSSRFRNIGVGGILLGRALIHPDKAIGSTDDIKLIQLKGLDFRKVDIVDWKDK